jgi:hypothetical protein
MDSHGQGRDVYPLEKNAREKCLIKEKFQRELLGRGKEKTKGKQNKINKDPLTDCPGLPAEGTPAAGSIVGGSGLSSNMGPSSLLTGRELLPWHRLTVV